MFHQKTVISTREFHKRRWLRGNSNLPFCPLSAGVLSSRLPRPPLCPACQLSTDKSLKICPPGAPEAAA